MATSHRSVLLAGLVWLLTVAVVVPWLATGESSVGGAECQRSCGSVEIPFPFGMGPDSCMLSREFYVVCYDTGNGALKPFLTYIIDDPTELNSRAEVLNISLEHGEARVLHPISSYCYNRTSGEMETAMWRWDLRSSYSFSSTANKFTVVGCRALAYIGDTRGNDVSAMYQTGCVAMCFDGRMALNPCSGMGCCQTDIPQSLHFYEVWFDQRLNMSGIDDGASSMGPCSFAVLMDSSNFTSSTSISSNNISSTEFINNNSSSAFNSSRGGKAPVVLDWSIGNDDCATARISPGYACVGGNSKCLNSASGRGYICNCKDGFQGNPYLPNDDGCQDIDECLQKEKYNCFGDCTNTNGSFACHCPSGSRGNASIPGGCQKEPFPRGARIIAGIVVGLFVALIAFLATEVFRNMEKRKRQRYFEHHGGRMLSRILETDGSNIAFTLYDITKIVKATRGFHKSTVVGEGAHGTVYKATLGTASVAVKRCKKIDKSRTEEFVQELVVLCRVSHPNIVRLLGCCLHFEAPMLVYEFVPNGTLSDLLHAKAPGDAVDPVEDSRGNRGGPGAPALAAAPDAPRRRQATEHFARPRMGGQGVRLWMLDN